MALSTDDMLAVLFFKRRQFEAEQYGQEIEIRVATDLEQEEVIAASTERRDYFAAAIESIDKLILELGGDPEAGPAVSPNGQPHGGFSPEGLA